jgi:outer membrane protein insertion porin family
VTEQPTGELSFSAGYSSVDQLVADIGITQRNFRGRGQDVTLKVSVGYLSSRSTSRLHRAALPRPQSRFAGFDLYSSRYNFSQYASYESASTGGLPDPGLPADGTRRCCSRYTLRSDNVIVDSSLCVPGQRDWSRWCCARSAARP